MSVELVSAILVAAVDESCRTGKGADGKSDNKLTSRGTLGWGTIQRGSAVGAWDTEEWASFRLGFFLRAECERVLLELVNKDASGPGEYRVSPKLGKSNATVAIIVASPPRAAF